MCRLGQTRELPREDPTTLGSASFREPVSLEARRIEQAFLAEMLEERPGRFRVQPQETLQHDYLDLLSEALPLDPKSNWRISSRQYSSRSDSLLGWLRRLMPDSVSVDLRLGEGSRL